MVRGTRAVLGRFKIGSYNLLLKVSETGVNTVFLMKELFMTPVSETEKEWAMQLARSYETL